VTRRILGAVFQSLDGVIQAPGGPTEDPTGGFAHGGWMAPLGDELVGRTIDGFFSGPFDLLLGRRTYEIFAAYWPFYDADEDMPIATSFNRAGKYVLTRGEQPLSWENSHRLPDLDALAALKAEDGPDLLIQGSGTLYPQLLGAGLLDRLTTMTFPVVLGRGKRLFGEETPSRTLRMTAHETSPDGVIVATYEPAGEIAVGTFPGPDPSAAEQDRQARMREGSW
jgi:dihydrofolate reductase